MRSKFVLFVLLALVWAAPAWAAQVMIEPVAFAKGSTIWLVENRDVPIVTVRMAFRDAGSTSDPADKEGRAQMAAALLDEGAGDKNPLQFQTALENKAIKLSFGVDQDELTVSMETLKENAGEAFALLGEALAHPRFDSEAIARIKTQMHAALKQAQENPTYLAGRALDDMIYHGHPYARPAEGTDASIDAITKADLKDYVSHFVTQGNLMMAVVGDTEKRELQTLLAAHLKDLPETFAAQSISPAEVKASGQTQLIQRAQPQTIVLYAGKGILRNDVDFYKAFVLNHLLGGGSLTSILADEIREKRGLAYYAYSGLDVMDHGAAFTGAFATRNDQAGAALKILLETLKRVAAGGVTQQELDDAKNYLIGAFPLQLASNDGLAAMLMVMQRFHLGMDYLDKRNDIIRAISLEDVKAVAKRLLQPDALAIVAIGQPKDDLKQIRTTQ